VSSTIQIQVTVFWVVTQHNGESRCLHKRLTGIRQKTGWNPGRRTCLMTHAYLGFVYYLHTYGRIVG